MTEDAKSNGVKDWNAMIYLAGENNLADECVFALKELKRARRVTIAKTKTTISASQTAIGK